MKITILGRGNAGCISALHFYNFSRFLTFKVEIELIYDSKIDPVPVGQGTILTLPRLLWEATDPVNLLKLNYTLKKGIMYENWGKKNKEWWHDFPLGTHGLHIDPKSFQDYVVNNLKINFKEKDEHIINYNEIDADYIIDCRGAPKEMQEYDTLINPLNCSLLSTLPKDDNVFWTRTIATPDGWCFYIPLKDRVSVGYNFNKSITSEEQAKKNFIDLFKVEKINKVFDFKQYVAKNPIIDKRIFLNGNKLFFVEPLEATAMGSYQECCRFIWDAIITKTESMESTSIKIKEYINKIQNFILWHYNFGSKYDTKFWDYAKKLYENNKNDDFESLIKLVNIHEKEYLKNGGTAYNYAQWGAYSMENWCEGMGVNK